VSLSLSSSLERGRQQGGGIKPDTRVAKKKVPPQTRSLRLFFFPPVLGPRETFLPPSLLLVVRKTARRCQL
jgi:hypothetical protein